MHALVGDSNTMVCKPILKNLVYVYTNCHRVIFTAQTVDDDFDLFRVLHGRGLVLNLAVCLKDQRKNRMMHTLIPTVRTKKNNPLAECLST